MTAQVRASAEEQRRIQFNETQKQARAILKLRGICVDCRVLEVKAAQPGKKPHVCCESCLEARRSREKGRNRQLRFFGVKGFFEIDEETEK